MNSFRNNPITDDELTEWNINKDINPRTKRKIKVNGRLYTFIKNIYIQRRIDLESEIEEHLTVLDSNDLRDPVSLKDFYKIDENGNKEILYDNLQNLVIYRESKTIVRCFEKESLEYMKSYKITSHPISQKEIPKNIFDTIKEKELNIIMTSKEKALQVFQLFTNISIFIDYNLFCDLCKKDLLKLNYELKDFYYQNFSDEDRSKIDGKDGKQFFVLKNDILDSKTLEEIKLYLLEQMENILNYKENDLKFMINYILLGGLSLVIDEVKKYYENFNFSF